MGIISKRLITENLIKDEDKNKKEKEIKQKITKILGIEPILVPELKGDTLAHTDGYMAFIDEKTILLSEYPEVWYKKHPGDKDYLERLYEILAFKQLDIKRIREYPEETPKKSKNECKMESARGIYVNFIRLNETFLVPSYPGYVHENLEKENYEILERYGKVIPVDCNALAKMGGILHCISLTN